MTRSCLLAFALTALGCEARTRVGFFNPNDYSPSGLSFPDGVAGIWTGYLEGYAFQSGSNVVTLTLDPSGVNDQIQVVFGTAQPPPPATDPGQEWPPADYVQSNLPQDRRGPFDGFSYIGHSFDWQGRRLAFSIAVMAPWDSWCTLQTSYPHGDSIDSTATCFPDADCGFCSADPPPAPSTVCPVRMNGGPIVTCAQYMNCIGVYKYCVCDDNQCEAPLDLRDSFFITFNNDTPATEAVGIVQINGSVELRLFR